MQTHIKVMQKVLQ